MGKFIKRQALEEGQRKFGGPKRGDKPFTSNVLPTAPVQAIPEYKKYAYLPSIDFIETAKLSYKEDAENLSPLHEALGIKVMQISYSSIAVSCNTSKNMVMNCLKEIFSTVLALSKQGGEISLDIKIGTLNIMRDNKLMFRNYNPDIVIDKKRNASLADERSRFSEVPTSVATPMTNAESTLSYRVQSQEVTARHTFNHVGIKRSGPSYQYNSDNNRLDGEKQYYRHKKDPYHNLDSFIMDNKFDIESKIQELRMKERQKMLNARKTKKAMSSSFHNLNNESFRRTFNNSAYVNGHQRSPLHSTYCKSDKLNIHNNSQCGESEGLNDNEPSTVNEKLPSRYFIDYPNFLKPAKYYPYRRLEEHHIADALQEARKRHEEKLVKIQQDDQKYNSMFFQGVEANKKRVFDIEMNRKKVYEEHKK